jgi:hypothetical protein
LKQFIEAFLGSGIHVRILGGVGDAHTTQNHDQWRLPRFLVLLQHELERSLN